MKTKREPLTLHDMQMRSYEADAAWNNFCMSHVEEKEAYEHDFDELGAIVQSEYEKNIAFKALIFEKHKRYCLGFAGEPGAYWLWAQMDFWREVCANYKIDKWTQDEALNAMQHWYKQLIGADDPIHHAYEPVKGQTFLPSKLTMPAPKKKSSTVTIKNNPL